MEEKVRITLEVGKRVAKEFMDGKNQELVLRHANAKFKALEKCKVINTAKGEQSAVEKLASTVERNAERNRRAIAGITDALKNNANSINALSDTQKTIVGNMDQIFNNAKAIKGISYLNTGLAVANLAVDVAGFVIISNKLTELGSELNDKLDKVIIKDKNDLEAEFQEIFMDFGFTARRINSGEDVPFKEYEKLLKVTRAYISKMAKNVVGNVIDAGLALEIIYTLLPAYSMIFNEYTKANYMKNGQKPANYDFMYQLYDELLTEQFKQTVEDYYFFVIFLRINSRRPQNSPMRCHTEGTA